MASIDNFHAGSQHCAYQIVDPTTIMPPMARREIGTPCLRLFCLPYAGGGTSIYSSWRKKLPLDVDLCALPFPGREHLWKEDLLTHLEPLIERLVETIADKIDLPYAFFGHSLGGLVAFELARRLRFLYGTNPAYLFVSGCQSPHLAYRLPPIHSLPSGEFIDQLRRRYDGIPQVIFENPEWLECILPILRADMAVLETYQYKNEVPFSCPIYAFGGLEDKLIGFDALEAWRIHTAEAFELQLYPGGHFFIHDTKLPLISVIAEQLQSAGWIPGEACESV